jgi:hypothetical protein
MVREPYGPPDCSDQQALFEAAKKEYENIYKRYNDLQKEIKKLEEQKEKLLKLIQRQLIKVGTIPLILGTPISFIESQIINILREIGESNVQQSLSDELKALFDEFTKINSRLNYKKQQNLVAKTQLKNIELKVIEALNELNACLQNQSTSILLL